MFANPHGIMFEIGCFLSAPGGMALADPCSDFTWFRGYDWQVAVCRGCSDHLGWFYSRRETGFWGLILDKMVTG